MIKRLLILCLTAVGLLAQTPNCSIIFQFDAAGEVSATGDNRTMGCQYWYLSYTTDFSTVSVVFQSTTGTTGPGTWGNYTGTINTGSNPSTATPTGAMTATGVVPWYRIRLASVTGGGTYVVGTLKGYIQQGAQGPAGPAGPTGPAGANGAISQVQVNGANQTVEPILDFIAGSNITITPVDDAPGTRTKLTIASSGGSGGLGVSGYYLNDGTNNYLPPIWSIATLPTASTSPFGSSGSWLNQGSAAFTTTGTAVTMTMPAQNSNNLRIRHIPIPTPPYTCDVAFIQNEYEANFISAGLEVDDGTKVITYATGSNDVAGQSVQTSYIPEFATWTNVTTFGADFASGPLPQQHNGPIFWLRFQDDNTNWKYFKSSDGQTWTQLASETRNTFLTATNIGVVMNQNNDLAGASLIVLHWLCH